MAMAEQRNDKPGRPTAPKERTGWLSRIAPGVRNAFSKRETPENLWVKCPDSGELVFHKDLEANLYVVPNSGYHMRVPVKARLESIFDDGKYEEIATPEAPLDPLKFRDVKRYTDRLKDFRTKTGAHARLQRRAQLRRHPRRFT